VAANWESLLADKDAQEKARRREIARQYLEDSSNDMVSIGDKVKKTVVDGAAAHDKAAVATGKHQVQAANS
jgi:hypothetical protein